MKKLSVIIIVRNEEKKIRDCLEKVKWADEIVVVDQSSTDRTVEICREYTDKVFITENKGFCEPDRMFAISKAASDWIFYIDVDEHVSPSLRKEIESVLSESDEKFDAYYVARKTFFLGKWIKHCGWYPSYVLRLFKKGKVHFDTEHIHQDGVSDGRCGYLKEDLLHYTYISLEDYFEKFNRYTTQLSKEEYEKGTRIKWYNGIYYFLFLPLAYFLQKYFIKKGFLDGFYGLLVCLSTFLTVFTYYAKLWERQKEE